MRRGVWGIVAALAALGAVGASEAAREASAQAPKVAACGPKQAKWFQGAPASTAEFVYGSGAGASYEEALSSSRVRAAEAIGVEVRSSTVERQRLEQGTAGTKESSTFESESRTRLERVVEGCQVVEACREGGEGVGAVLNPYHVLTKCYRKSREEREAEERAAIGALAACSAEKPWASRAPSMTADHVFGVASGKSLALAEASARVRAAETLGVEVKSRTADRQVLWQKDGKTHDASEFEQVAESVVARRLEGCEIVDRCREASAANVLLRCFRRSAFERELERIGALLAARLPKEARVLAVPGTDRDGFITGLGELGTSTLRASIDRALPPGAVLLRVQQWEPAGLHEIGRKHGATHLLRLEYARKGPAAVHVEAWLQRADNDVDVPGSNAVAEVELDEGSLTLLEARGPLLPQKDALSIAAELAPARLAAKVPPRLVEGREVELEFRAERPGFLYVFSLAESGEVVMLHPAAEAPDARVPAGPYRFPDAEFRKATGAGVVACGAPGQKLTRENVKAVLASRPLALPPFEGPVLTFAPGAGPRGVAALLEALNRARREGALLADVTAPYLIEASPRGRGVCP